MNHYLVPHPCAPKKRILYRTTLRFLLLLFCFLNVAIQSSATVYYTASASATLNGSATPSNNWTTNTDGTTGLGNATITQDDDIVLLAGAVVTMTDKTFIKSLTIKGNCNLTGNATNTLVVRLETTLNTGVFTLNAGSSFQFGNRADPDNNVGKIMGTPNASTICIDASNATIILGGGILGGTSLANKAFKDYTIRNVEVNHLAGNIISVCNTDLTITGSLILTSGVIFMGNNFGTTTTKKITVSENATITGGGYTSMFEQAYVFGPLCRNTNATNDYAFPVGGGEAQIYGPVIIKPTSNTLTTYQVSFDSNLDGFPVGTMCNSNKLTAVSRKQQWDISRTSGTAKAQITLPYSNTIDNKWGTPDATNGIVVAHQVSGCWQDETGTVLAGDATSGTVTSKELDNFSPFTLGYGPLAILPHTLTDFSGTVKTGYNQLQWATANESGADKMEIENSTDGNSFVTIGSLNSIGIGNHSYSFLHYATKPNNFYRLKITTANGQYNYSKIIRLSAQSNAAVAVYPSPAKNYIMVSGSQTISQLQMINSNGAIVLQKNNVQPNESVAVTTLPAGVYVVRMEVKGVVINQKIIKQ